MHQLPGKASTGSTAHLLLAHQMDPTSGMLTESCQIASCLDKPPLWLTLASWRLFNPKAHFAHKGADKFPQHCLHSLCWHHAFTPAKFIAPAAASRAGVCAGCNMSSCVQMTPWSGWVSLQGPKLS